MNAKFLLLAFMATVAISAGANQKFYSRGRSTPLPRRNNYCTRPLKAGKTLVMNRKCYYAFSVCSNGHILLLPNVRSKVYQYTKPRNLLSLKRYPIVTAFWARTNTERGGRRYNRVSYGQSSHHSLKKQIKFIVNDANFTPKTVIWATYYNMRSIRGGKTNTFQIILATTGRVTYAILIYRNMGWDKYCRRCPRPYVGYANGKGLGYQYTLPRSAAKHLSHSIKIFRISDKQWAKVATQANEESLATLEEALNKVQGSEAELQSVNGAKEEEDDDVEDGIAMDDEIALTSEEEDEELPEFMKDVMQEAMEDGRDEEEEEEAGGDSDGPGAKTSKKKKESGVRAAKKDV